MKKKILMFTLMIFSVILVGCGENNSVEKNSQEKVSAAPVENISEEKGMKKLKITVGEKILYATLENNSTTQDFIKKLPTTLKMENLYGREMCYRYGKGGLAESNFRSDRYEVGDIIYWAPRGSFVILYKQNGEEFERVQVGHIDDDVKFFENVGDVEIKFELVD